MDSEQGQLFALYYSAISADNTQCIIHIPAFFEEMNKSRHMITKQASVFAEQSCSVLGVWLQYNVFCKKAYKY